jgi:GNAT superfamily N-acetyltransferase
MSGAFTIEAITGPDIRQHLDAAADLRIRVFREFPYLYDGNLAYEAAYLNQFAAAPGAVLVLARNGQTIVGCATAMAMIGADPEFRQPFVKGGMALERIFYFGESVLDSDWRGRGIGHHFFDQREAQARQYGASITTFCAVQRPTDHPLRPANYRPLDPFWQKRGYIRRDDLNTEFSWKDIDQASETRKRMVFWTRE